MEERRLGLGATLIRLPGKEGTDAFLEDFSLFQTVSESDRAVTANLQRSSMAGDKARLLVPGVMNSRGRTLGQGLVRYG